MSEQENQAPSVPPIADKDKILEKIVEDSGYPKSDTRPHKKSRKEREIDRAVLRTADPSKVDIATLMEIMRDESIFGSWSGDRARRLLLYERLRGSGLTPAEISAKTPFGSHMTEDKLKEYERWYKNRVENNGHD